MDQYNEYSLYIVQSEKGPELSIKIAGNSVALTPIEQKVLAYLLASVNEPVYIHEIQSAVWGTVIKRDEDENIVGGQCGQTSTCLGKIKDKLSTLNAAGKPEVLTIKNQGKFQKLLYLDKAAKGVRIRVRDLDHDSPLDSRADSDAGASAKLPEDQTKPVNLKPLHRIDASKAHNFPLSWEPGSPEECPLISIFPSINEVSQKHLLDAFRNANKRFIAFGLTRNFYVDEAFKEVLVNKATQIPIDIFLLNPDSASRVDRYRIEPTEAALEDPGRMKREIVGVYRQILKQANANATDETGLNIYFFNFPCSFAMEIIDDECRVALYGHGKRGTESPIFVFRSGTHYFDYFESQIEWMKKLVETPELEPWASKGIEIQKLE